MYINRCVYLVCTLKKAGDRTSKMCLELTVTFDDIDASLCTDEMSRLVNQVSNLAGISEFFVRARQHSSDIIETAVLSTTSMTMQLMVSHSMLLSYSQLFATEQQVWVLH